MIECFRKRLNDDEKGTPEMTRLLGPSMGRQSAGNTPLMGNQSPTILTYHPNHSLRGLPPPHPPPMNYPEGQMINNFGTLQRNAYGTGMRANMQTATLGRPHHPESYAAINKNSALVNNANAIQLQRRGSQTRNDHGDSVTYGSNALYSTYARTPQSVNFMPPQTPNNAVYGTYAGVSFYSAYFQTKQFF